MRIWWSLILVAVAACGGSSPVSPDTPAPPLVPLGPQLLEITHQPTSPFCGIPAGAGSTLLVMRMTLAWSGSEWVATPATSADGTVQVHFRPSGTATASSIPVTGTITGTAIHQSELFFGVPPWTAQMSVVGGGSGILTGTATAAGVKFPYAAVDGTGTGSVTVTDGAGIVCAGASFEWSLVAGRS